MRRISTGVQGRPILGKYFSVDNVLSTLETNTDIRLEPSGSGKVVANSSLRVSSGNSLEIVSNNTSNSINFSAPSSLGSDINFTFPNSTGTDGFFLRTDGSGNLSWDTAALDVANQTADTATYFPLLSTSSSGSISDVTVSSSKLSFQPSSGNLTVNQFTSNSVDIGGGSIDNTTIGGNTAAAGTFTSITETSSKILKDNIRSIENTLDKVINLDPVSYTRKSTGEKEIGLIAEDVEPIFPELVKTDGEFKSISYSRLTAYLIDSIKDLNAKLDRLET